MAIDIDEYLQQLLDSDPGSAEAVNIRIVRAIYPSLELRRDPWGLPVCRVPEVWGRDRLELDFIICGQNVYASVWVDEHQFRVYAEVGLHLATLNPDGFGWLPVPGWESAVKAWPPGLVKVLKYELGRNAAINW